MGVKWHLTVFLIRIYLVLLLTKSCEVGIISPDFRDKETDEPVQGDSEVE